MVRIPSGYDRNVPLPLVLDMHGWGRDATYEAQVSGMEQASEIYGFVVAFPEGSADNRDGLQSWNVAGSSHAVGPQGPTCIESASTKEYCYRSCAPCHEEPQCSWATCLNDVTETGVGVANVTGFLPRIYDQLTNTVCIDESRLYATGKSNGGMATYQLGVSLSDRLAAIAPIAGSFQLGYAQAPPMPVPVMDIHGTEDTSIPANGTLSSDGYYYTKTVDIAANWSVANGCSGAELSQWPTSLDGKYGLFCKSQGSDCKAPTVRCSWEGGHLHFGDDPEANSQLVWEFLSQFSRRSSEVIVRTLPKIHADRGSLQV